MDHPVIVDRLAESLYLTKQEFAALRGTCTYYRNRIDFFKPKLRWNCSVCGYLHLDCEWKLKEFSFLHFRFAQEVMERALLDAAILLLALLAEKTPRWVIRKCIPFEIKRILAPADDAHSLSNVSSNQLLGRGLTEAA